MEKDKPPLQALQECEERLKHLEEENQHLREASHAFGQLAERLNVTLQQECRKAGHERRQRQRPESDRRQQPNSTVQLPPDASPDQE